MAAPHPEVGPWRHRAAAGAVVTGISLGLRDALAPERDDVPVVVPAPDLSPDDDAYGITLYFHPEVPEATLVLLRRPAATPPAAPT